MKESLELIKRGIDEVLTEDDLVSKLKSLNVNTFLFTKVLPIIRILTQTPEIAYPL